MEHIAFRNADYHIPISTGFKKMLIDLYGIDDEKINNPIGIGINTDKFKPSDVPDKLTLGYFIG